MTGLVGRWVVAVSSRGMWELGGGTRPRGGLSAEKLMVLKIKIKIKIKIKRRQREEKEKEKRKKKEAVRQTFLDETRARKKRMAASG